jgi:hypothetical protein
MRGWLTKEGGLVAVGLGTAPFGNMSEIGWPQGLFSSHFSSLLPVYRGFRPFGSGWQTIP